METRRFDTWTRSLSGATTRRVVCKTLTAGVVGAALTRLGLGGAAAGCTRIRKKCNKKDECCGSLACGKPTTRHTCSSTVQGVRKWCCIKPGDRCTGECDCCGDNYCSFGSNPRVGKCVRNPEG